MHAFCDLRRDKRLAADGRSMIEQRRIPVQVLHAYSRFLDGLTKVLRVILIVMLSAMVLIMFYQVIMRYIFSDAQPWCEELTLYLGVFNIFLSLSIATRRESHLQVDFLLRLYSPRVKCLMTAISSIVAIVVMVVFAVYSIDLMGHATGQSFTMPIKMQQVYAAFPIGAVLVCLYSIELVVRNLIGFFHNGELPALEGGKKA
jgi:TRAP-type C4-dicarboxylate transport system permease small subunit